MYLDVAVAYDRRRRRVDLVYQVAGGRGRLAIDRTALTPVLLRLGSDRRAASDDVLPDGSTEGSIAAGINHRRGVAGDCLARGGLRAGSRLWLLERAKLGEQELLAAEDYATEALDPLARREGVAIEVHADEPVRDVLRLRCKVGAALVTVQPPRALLP